MFFKFFQKLFGKSKEKDSESQTIADKLIVSLNKNDWEITTAMRHYGLWIYMQHQGPNKLIEIQAIANEEGTSLTELTIDKKVIHLSSSDNNKMTKYLTERFIYPNAIEIAEDLLSDLDIELGLENN